MKRFTRLCHELEEASQPREKVAALVAYFREAAPIERAHSCVATRKLGLCKARTIDATHSCMVGFPAATPAGC